MTPRHRDNMPLAASTPRHLPPRGIDNLQPPPVPEPVEGTLQKLLNKMTYLFANP